MLATSALCPIRVDPDLILIDLYGGRLPQVGNHVDSGEAGVTTGVRIERADPDETMDTPLRLEGAIGAVPSDGEGGRLDPGLLTVCQFLDGDAEAPIGQVALIHAGKHLRPVLGVDTPGTGVD